MADNTNKEKYSKKLAEIFNEIAANNPEMLNSLMTDELLECVMKELYFEMEQELHTYEYAFHLMTTPPEDCYRKDKDYWIAWAKVARKSLVSQNELYKAYESLRASRNLDIEHDFDPNLVEKALNDEEKVNILLS